MRRRSTATLLAAVAALAIAGPAGAVIVPVSRIHAVANTYERGVLLPTVLPRGVNRVDLRAGGAVGNGPRAARTLSYLAGTRQAFQIFVWRGSRRAAVVKALLARDGSSGSTKSFVAGRFAGTVETQKSADASVAAPASYVWQRGGYTYMLAFATKPGTTTPAFEGLAPTRTIASFKK